MTQSIEDLRGLLERATPGPLHVETRTLDNVEEGYEPEVYIVHPGTVCDLTAFAVMGNTGTMTVEQKQANAALIVAAVNALPGLLDRIDELEMEAELFDKDHADQNRMVDRIADLIGLPHDQELDIVSFELWFSARTPDPASTRALEEARGASYDQQEALKTTTSHLVAAISLLRKYHEACAPTKRHALFGTMIADYEKAAKIGRSALKPVVMSAGREGRSILSGGV